MDILDGRSMIVPADLQGGSETKRRELSKRDVGVPLRLAKE